MHSRNLHWQCERQEHPALSPRGLFLWRPADPLGTGFWEEHFETAIAGDAAVVLLHALPFSVHWRTTGK